jgi:hypothetical protein
MKSLPGPESPRTTAATGFRLLEVLIGTRTP